VAQVYVGEAKAAREAKAAIERPEKELKGFERVQLQPGETKHVALRLDPRSFSYYDVKSSSWQADAGTYTVLLGDSSQDIQQRTTIQLSEPITTSVSQ
jgi:beta-glucosidase